MNTGDPVFSDGVRKIKTVTAAAARTALAVQGTAEKGIANGYASLGADGKVPAAQIPAVSGDPAPYIHAAAEKTPDNDDELTFVDSAASWVLKKIKWSSMVSIFSGLFSAVGHTHDGVYEPADTDIQAHVTGTGSPHTPAGIGAEVAGAAATAVGSHESSYNHALLHNPVTVTGNGLSLAGQQVSLSIGSGASQVAAGNHLHAGVYDAAGEATGAVADHEDAYDHSKLHDPVTVVGNGLTLFGQQVTLHVGAEIDHVASGIHEHSEYVEKSLLTTAGDLLYRTTVPARLPIGTAFQKLRVNSGATAPEWATDREVLSSDRTYYVRTDGNDSNTGLADTSDGAFLTIQKAVDIAATLDGSIYNIYIYVRSGTYTGAVTLKNWLGSGSIYLIGDVTTPSNVVISTTSNNCISANGLRSTYQISGFKLQTATSGNCVSLSGKALLYFNGKMEYGACAGWHIVVSGNSTLYLNASYTISAGCGVHWYCAEESVIFVSAGITITISGTPAFSTYFAFATRVGFILCYSITFSGSATGTRYLSDKNSVLDTNGGGATYLPGNALGSTATGGQYI